MADPSIPGTDIKASQVSKWLMLAKEIVYGLGIVGAIYGVVTGHLSADQLANVVKQETALTQWNTQYTAGLAQKVAPIVGSTPQPPPVAPKTDAPGSN